MKPRYNALWANYRGSSLYINDELVDYPEGKIPTGLFMSIYKGKSIREESVEKPNYIKPNDLRDWQEHCLSLCLNSPKRRGVVKAATGTGKTRVQIEMLRTFKSGVITVPTRQLLHQTYDLLEELMPGKVGRVGDGHYELKDYIVAIPKTILNKGLPKVDIWLADECHRLSNLEGWQTQLLIPSYWRFGFSATPAEDLIETCIFGPRIYTYNPNHAIEDGVILKPEVQYHSIKCLDLGTLAYRANKYFSSGFRDKMTIYSQCLNKAILPNVERNKLIVDLYLKCKSKGHKTIIIVERINGKNNQPEAINNILSGRGLQALPIYSSKTSKPNKKKILEEFKEGKLDCIIAGPNSISEGADIKECSALILATADASTKKLIQRVGRVLRLGNEKPVIHCLQDEGYFFTNLSSKKKNILEETYNSI